MLLHEKVNDFRWKGIGDQTANNALRDIERKSRQADSRLTGFNQKEVRFPPTIKRKPKLFFRIKAFLLSRHENQTHSASKRRVGRAPRRNVEMSQKKEREAIDAAFKRNIGNEGFRPHGAFGRKAYVFRPPPAERRTRAGVTALNPDSC